MSEAAKGIAVAGLLIGASFIPGLNVAVAGFVFNAGLGIGLSLLAQELAPKPRTPRLEPRGAVLDAATTGEGASAGFIVGRSATRGHLVYHNSHGNTGETPNEFYTRVIELSDAPSATVRRVALGDEWLDLVDSSDEYGLRAVNGRFTVDGEPYLFVRFYNGNQTAADPYLIARYGASGNAYSSDMVGRGICYAIVTYRSHPSMWQGNLEPIFEMGGIPLYDPRKDSTAGGSGAHRWGNPATYAATENPIVIAYNVARGISLPDGQIYGGGLGSDSLPVTNWAAAMNVCDVSLGSGFGGSRTQYTFGAEVLVAEVEPAALIERCLGACQGQISEMGGVFRVHAGSPAVASWAITDGDLSASDPAMFEPIRGLGARFNGITSTYVDPSRFWQPASPPPLYNATWEAEDGNRRLVADLQLGGVFDRSQASQIQRGMIADERRQRQHQIVLPPDALRLRVLDTISWTSEENGYIDKLFEVVALEQRTDTLFVGVTLRERDPTDYDWSSDFELPSLPNVLQIPPTPAQQVAGWAVAGIAISDSSGGARRPAIRLSWDASQMRDVEFLRWELRLASLDVIASGVASVVDGQVVVSGPILPGAAYEARGRIIATRATAWTAWLGAVAPDAPLGLVDFEQSVQDEIDKGQQALDIAATKLDTILPGTVGVDELIVGLGANEIDNALPLINGIEGWSLFFDHPDPTSAGLRTGTYSHPTEGTFFIYQNGPGGGVSIYTNRGVEDVNGTITKGVLVAPGEWWEASGYISAHGCFCRVQIEWYDGSGNPISSSGGSVVSTQSSSTNPKLWEKSHVVAQAPPFASYAAFSWVKLNTVSPNSDSYLFGWRPMLASTKENAQPRPFSPPPTTYIGPQGIATNAITAEKITAEVVRAKAASFGTVNAFGLIVDDASITNAKIGSAEIDRLKLRGNNIVESYGSFVGFQNYGAITPNVWIDSTGEINAVPFIPSRDTLMTVSARFALYSEVFAGGLSGVASDLELHLEYYSSAYVRWNTLHRRTYPYQSIGGGSYTVRRIDENLFGSFLIPANTGALCRLRFRQGDFSGGQPQSFYFDYTQFHAFHG